MRASARVVALTLSAVLCAPGLSACSGTTESRRQLPVQLVPSGLNGLTFPREAKAEVVWSKKKMRRNSLISEGRVFTVRDGATIQGDIQLAVFKPEIDTGDLTDSSDVRCAKHPKECSGHRALLGMQSTLGEGPYTRIYVGDQRVYVKSTSDLRLYLWFPVHTQSYVLLVLRNAYGADASDRLMEALVTYESKLPTHAASPTPAAKGTAS